MDEFFEKMNDIEKENAEPEVADKAEQKYNTDDFQDTEPVNSADAQTQNGTESDFTASFEEKGAESAAQPVSDGQFESNSYGDGQYSPPYNPINYSEIKPIENYKPMSRGLKVFSLILVALILLSAASLTGYHIGKNSVNTTRGKVSLNLASKPADTDEMTAQQVYEKLNKSIVGILAYNADGDGAQASGVIYSEDGYVITNDHIYASIASPLFRIYTYDGKEYNAKYVAGDKISDLAVLKIDDGKFDVAEFGNSDEVVCGEGVLALGRPNDATRTTSITKGIVSLTDRRGKTTSDYLSKLIQTDSAINPGSSGGALVNMYGQVIGITSSKIVSVQYESLGYAIPTVTVKRVVEELISKGRVESRGKLGITYNAISPLTAELNGYDHFGLLVVSVTRESDLYGKVQKNDVITEINGIQVTSDDVVLDIIDNSTVGDKLTLTVVTESGTTKTVEAKLIANIGESSYTTEKSDIQDGTENKPENGGTFDFPSGE